MIRTKAKSLLLSIVLVMASLIFFACKEETYVKAESIKFEEQNIDLLVGDEYNPHVKILPSYATDRSYTLISGDNTALAIDGGTIKAIRAAKGIVLKVEYNADRTFNDAIIVNIYAESQQLDTPTNLTFDGNGFSFVGVEDAEAYILEINGQEINIGNNTQYMFENVVAKLGDLHDQKLECSVRAVGDGKVFTDSESSEVISFVKMSSVKNVRVEDDALLFDRIANVTKYDIVIELNGEVVSSTQVSTEEFDLTELIASGANDGAEYVIKISPSKDGYDLADIDEVFSTGDVAFNYAVIGKVDNVMLNGKVVSWDFVKNAENYTVRIYNGADLIYENVVATNNVTLTIDDAGDYSCEVVANSSAANVATGSMSSNRLQFAILQNPAIITNNNQVVLCHVDNATNYFVTVSAGLGTSKEVIKQTFIDASSDIVLDVADYESGNYSVEVVAYSDNQNVLPSKLSTASWVKLGLTAVVGNGDLSWTDDIANSIKKYQIIANGITKEVDGANSIELDEFGFIAIDDAEEYPIAIKAIGSGAIFDSNIVEGLSVVKLPDAKIIELKNNKFNVEAVDYAGAKCELEIRKQGEYITTLTGSYELNVADLTAGNYTAKAIVTGNKKNVLDADNLSENNFITFSKLASPELKVENGKLDIGSMGGEVKYALAENNTTIENAVFPYDLSDKTAGEYSYYACAIGNGGNVLDSDKGNVVKVRKLAQPTISFNKATLTCTINCADAEYVQNYTVYIDGTQLAQQITPENNSIDCSANMLDARQYSIKVVANPKTSSKYALIVASEKTATQTRLSGECDFSVDGGNLIVEPTMTLNESNTYTLTITIDKGLATETKLSNIKASEGKFVINILDDKYNIKNFASIFTGEGAHTIHTVISSSGSNELNSIESECAESERLKVLGKVSSISKQGQAIQFSSVSGSTGYQAIVELGGDKKIVDLTGKYSDYKISIDTLKLLMAEADIEYVENVDYSIRFVAITTNANTLSNVGAEFKFKFANKPTLKISTDASTNEKLIKFNDGLQHEVIIESGSKTIKEIYNGTPINLDTLTYNNGIESGTVKISANTIPSDGNSFNSEYKTINATKIASDTPVVNKGVVSWEIVEHAKYYVLGYMEAGQNKTIVLDEVSDKFTIDMTKGVCTYNFVGLNAGSYDVTLQVYVEDGNYLNSNKSSSVKVYKLAAPVISVENGLVCIVIDSSEQALSNTQSVELKFANNKVIDDMIVIGFDKISIAEDYKDYAEAVKLASYKTKITIDATEFIEYGTTELLAQEISAKALAITNKQVLNSEVATKEIRGLLAPQDIAVEKTSSTTAGTTSEEFATISWYGPEANGENVGSCKVYITYDGPYQNTTKKETYELETSISYNSNTRKYSMAMPKFYNENIEDSEYELWEDVNGNGVLDEGEDIDGNGKINGIDRLFQEGEYTITIRFISNNNSQFVHSDYSSITTTALAAPTNVRTSNGQITWTMLGNGAENYSVRIYNLTYPSKEVKVIPVSDTTLDISDIELDDGVYGVTVQALHSSNRVLMSAESEMTQMVRLPKVTNYYIDDGEMYIKVHRFFGECKITFVSKEDGSEEYETIINTVENNEDIHGDIFDEFVSDTYFKWSESTILNTFADNAYYDVIKVPMDKVSNTGEGYRVYITLVGNTHPESGILTTPEAEAICDAGVMNRLPTPIVEIDETTRGLLNLTAVDVSYGMTYKDTSGKELTGAHLYKATITTAGKDYIVYMAEAVETMKLDGKIVDSAAKYIDFGGVKYNIVTKTGRSIKIDFNTRSYEVYNYWNESESTSLSFQQGGSFVVTMQMLGDDTCFISSKVSNAETIWRYKPIDHNNATLIIDGGKIKWEKQTVASDDAAYLLEVSNTTKTIKIMLYQPDLGISEYTLSTMLENEGKTGCYFDTISYADEDQYIIYDNLANKLREIDNTFNGGDFTIRVMSHYTNLTAMNVVLAQTAPAKSITIIPQATIEVKNGTLTWNRPYVRDSSTTGITYFDNYQLQVFKGVGFVATIDLSSVDYTVIDGQIEFNLKSEFGLDTLTNYTFNLIAVGDNAKYINSAVTNVKNKQILNDVTGVSISTKQETNPDGEAVYKTELTWSGAEKAEILIHFIVPSGDGGAKYSYTEIVSGGKYTLPNKVYIHGIGYELKSGYSYSFQVRAIGDSKYINGFFSTEVTIQKLFTVDGIKIDKQGVLTWNPSRFVTNFTAGTTSSDGIEYAVEYSYVDAQGQTVTELSEYVMDTEYDLRHIEAEEISVIIYAYHTSYTASNPSEKVEFNRLIAPNAGTIQFVEDGTVMQWTPITNNDEVYKHYMIKVTDGINVATYGYELGDSQIAKWNIEIDDRFSGETVKFSIKALVVDEGMMLDSLYSAEVEQTITAKLYSVSYDSANYAIKWSPLSGEGYKYYLGYKFNNTTDVYEDVTNDLVKLNGEYYYYLNTIGLYSDVYVRVVGSSDDEYNLASQPTMCLDPINFNIFESGSGVSGDPYIIKSEDQLRNVVEFPNAYYQLGGDIYLTSADVIAEEFSGTLDGSGAIIYCAYSEGVGMEQDGNGNVGLFASTNRAVFKNISLSGFDLNIEADQTDANIAILVSVATDTTFTNVSIVGSTISYTLTQTGSAGLVINIGAIAGHSINSEFTNCEVLMRSVNTSNININATGVSGTVISVGSIVGFMDNGSVATNKSGQNTFVMSYELDPLPGKTNSPQLYVGTIAGIANHTPTISGEYYSAIKNGENYTDKVGYGNYNT